ncbi:MAG: dockerin type I domain-containing protein, partial [Pirellulales bacterium]
HQDLMASPEYRQRFADRVEKHFGPGGALSQAAILERWSNRAAEVEHAVIGESARWGDAVASRANNPFTQDDWRYAVQNTAERFFPNRNTIFFDQLRTARWPDPAQGNALVPAPLYPNVPAPILSQHGGVAPLGHSLQLTLPPAESFTDTVLVADGAPVRAFAPVDNNLGTTWTLPDFNNFAGWTDGSTGTGVGYETSPTSITSYSSLIRTDLRTQMLNRSPSLFMRTTFTTTGVEDYDKLLLRMKFDDGFVAYLDGVEVARSGNMPRGVPPYNELAGRRDDFVAVDWEYYDLSPFLHLLTAGSHVLAIHGLNYHVNDTDMLILPELVGRHVATSPTAGTIYYTTDGSDPRMTGGGVSANAVAYTSPHALTAPGPIKARTLSGGTWSGLVDVSFSIDWPLRVTEVMFNPAPQTARELSATPGGNLNYDNDQYEFIELTNIGIVPMDLTGFAFTDGLQMALTGGVLAPGESGVLVQHAGAFANRYGEHVRVLGEYGGGASDYHLGNGGETIALVDTLGSLVQRFTYDDAWHQGIDGQGKSLVPVDAAAAADWNLATSWRASYDLGGSPGSEDRMQGDVNEDLRVDLQDLLILRRNYGRQSGATRSQGDLNGDGAVSRSDLALLTRSFGRNEAVGVPVAPAPTPPASDNLRATRRTRPAAVDEVVTQWPADRPMTAIPQRTTRLRASRS